MASPPFPIVPHDHTKAGIRWRVSIHPELCAEGTTVMRFLKRGRPGRLLDQLCRWSPQDGWAHGHAPNTRVPQLLRERIDVELAAESSPPRQPSAAGATRAPAHRCSIPEGPQAISCGWMSFPAFLAMELIEAYLPLWDPQPTAVQAH